MRPWLLRPALLLSGVSRDFSGLFFVTSSKVKPVIPRRPGDVGLYCLTGISVAASHHRIRSAAASRPIGLRCGLRLYSFDELYLVARPEG